VTDATQLTNLKEIVIELGNPIFFGDILEWSKKHLLKSNPAY
jgi:hypothetical protein